MHVAFFSMRGGHGAEYVVSTDGRRPAAGFAADRRSAQRRLVAFRLTAGGADRIRPGCRVRFISPPPTARAGRSLPGVDQPERAGRLVARRHAASRTPTRLGGVEVVSSAGRKLLDLPGEARVVVARRDVSRSRATRPPSTSTTRPASEWPSLACRLGVLVARRPPRDADLRSGALAGSLTRRRPAERRDPPRQRRDRFAGSRPTVVADRGGTVGFDVAKKRTIDASRGVHAGGVGPAVARRRLRRAGRSGSSSGRGSVGRVAP